MIPDRLYIDESELPKVNNLPMDNPITYIRKDALVDWLKEMRKTTSEQACILESVKIGADAAFEEILNHINEM